MTRSMHSLAIGTFGLRPLQFTRVGENLDVGHSFLR